MTGSLWDVQTGSGDLQRHLAPLVLADLEGQVARMLDFIGVPFEERCLRYYETERAVRTPSSEQVRQPLYRDAVSQWQHYAQWLEPLRRSLAETGP